MIQNNPSESLYVSEYKGDVILQLLAQDEPLLSFRDLLGGGLSAYEMSQLSTLVISLSELMLDANFLMFSITTYTLAFNIF